MVFRNEMSYFKKYPVLCISKDIEFIRLYKQNDKCEELYTAMSFISLPTHIPYLAAQEVV